MLSVRLITGGPGLVAMIAFCVSAGAQQIRYDTDPSLTPADLAAIANIQRLDTKLVLDHDQYLPGETARVTFTLRNPTAAKLSIPVPFSPSTGGCYLVSLSATGEELRRLVTDMDYNIEAMRPNLPTMLLDPGQELSSSITTADRHVGWNGGLFSPSPGRYRLRYGYDYKAYADFRVVSPTKLWSLSMVHLRPTEAVDRRTFKVVTASSTVVLMVVETVSGEFWLFRSDPICCQDPSPWPFREYTLRIFSDLHGFERVAQLEKPPRPCTRN